MRDYRPARGGLASANEKRFLLETKGGTGQGVRQTRYMKTGHSRMGCDLLFCVVRPEGVEPSTLGLKGLIKHSSNLRAYESAPGHPGGLGPFSPRDIQMSGAFL